MKLAVCRRGHGPLLPTPYQLVFSGPPCILLEVRHAYFLKVRHAYFLDTQAPPALSAGEAMVPFYQMAGTEFTEGIVGVGAARVR
jgi:hypothetical protein